MSLLAGVDVGTSALKLVVLDPADPAGRVLARAGAEYPTATAPGGVAEQDPEDWWRAAQAASTASMGLANSSCSVLTATRSTRCGRR